MKPIFPHRSATDVPDTGDTSPEPPPVAEYHACCCPGRPVVRVIMPATAGRPRPVDLLLCGHHYRVSRAAIAAAHGTVEDLPGCSGDVAAALFRKVAEPAVAVGPALPPR